MKQIKELIQSLDYELLQGSLEGEISELVYDTRKVSKDAMFVCIVGTAFDSHEKAVPTMQTNMASLLTFLVSYTSSLIDRKSTRLNSSHLN